MIELKKILKIKNENVILRRAINRNWTERKENGKG